MALAWMVKTTTLVAAAATTELLAQGEVLVAVAALPVVGLMIFAARQRARRRARGRVRA